MSACASPRAEGREGRRALLLRAVARRLHGDPEQLGACALKCASPWSRTRISGSCGIRRARLCGRGIRPSAPNGLDGLHGAAPQQRVCRRAAPPGWLSARSTPTYSAARLTRAPTSSADLGPACLHVTLAEAHEADACELNPERELRQSHLSRRTRSRGDAYGMGFLEASCR